MAKTAYEKPAEEWTEKEIEVEKLRLEAHRAKSEASIGRRYGTIILSGVFAITGSVVAYYSNNAADTRASQAAREETERNLAQNAVRVYFENPERFDLKTEEGKFNLRVLADTAPGKTTATLISQIQDNAVQIATANAEIAAAAPVGTAAVAAPGASPVAAAPAVAKNYSDAVKDAQAARYASLSNAPSVVQNPTQPSDFSIYIHFGEGARGQAGDLQRRIRDLGYGVRRPELSTTPTEKPEIRYFSQAQQKFAEQLAAQLKDSLGGQIKPHYLGAEYPNIPADIMEVWLPPQGLSSEQAYKQGTETRGVIVEQRAQDIVRQESNKLIEPLARRGLPLGN